MPTLSAASRLREQVLAIPGTVLLAQAGHVDKVIRFQHVPDYLAKHDEKFTKGKRPYIFINLDRGPDQEIWSTTMKGVYSEARRDKPIPEAIPVAPECKAEWNVGPEDVPLIENGLVIVEATKPVEAQIFKCDICGITYDKERAIRMHKMKAHKL